MTIKSNYCQAPDCEKLRDKKQGSAFCPMHRARRSRYKSLEVPIKSGLPEGVAMICRHHGNRTIDQVYKNGNYNYYRCTLCKKINEKKHRDNNPDRKMTRNFYFIGRDINRIKIEKTLYEKMFHDQNGLCAICKNPETLKTNNKKHTISKRLAVDHCHITNKIRGLLCHHCNVSLGGFKDSIETLKAAINYLDQFNID